DYYDMKRMMREDMLISEQMMIGFYEKDIFYMTDTRNNGRICIAFRCESRHDFHFVPIMLESYNNFVSNHIGKDILSWMVLDIRINNTKGGNGTKYSLDMPNGNRIISKRSLWKEKKTYFFEDLLNLEDCIQKVVY